MIFIDNTRNEKNNLVIFSDPVNRNGWYLSSWANTNSIQTLSQVSLKIMIIRLLKLKFLLFSNSFSDQTLIYNFISIVLLSFLFYYFTRFSLILLILSSPYCSLQTRQLFYFLFLTKVWVRFNDVLLFFRAEHLITSRKLQSKHLGCCFLAVKAYQYLGN